MMIRHTCHSRLRCAQRGLTQEEIEYVMEFGSVYHREGALIFFMRAQDLPDEDRRKDWAAQLVGTALVLSRDGRTLVTAWRNRESGLKIIKRKPAYRWCCYEEIDGRLGLE